MKWSAEAEKAVSRVPFFVRKRVKKRVEEEAANAGASEVRMEHVESCRKRFLGNMEDEVRGYQVETCFGSGGCPNRAVTDKDLADRLDTMLKARRIREILKEKVGESLKMHHEFRVSVSDCPNACSRPQIVDVGLIGVRRPKVGNGPCSGCGSCVAECREGAVTLTAEQPSVDPDRCLNCGRCIAVCPSGTLEETETGYRILLGGRLGRHPQLGRELPGIYSADEAVEMVRLCIDHHLAHMEKGERFGELLHRKPLHISSKKNS